MSKLAWIVVLATLTAAPAAAQQGAIPDLRGTWKGQSESIILGAGNPHHAAPPSAEPRLNSVAFTATIDKQDGRVFSGTFSSPRGDEKFVAAISRNNTILVVDDDGYTVGHDLGAKPHGVVLPAPVASYAHGILHGADQAAVGDPPPLRKSAARLRRSSLRDRLAPVMRGSRMRSA